MKVDSKFQNKMLKRQEIEATFSSDKNPGFEIVRNDLANDLNISSDQIVVKEVMGSFGKREFKIKAYIYESAKDREMIEPKKKVKKTEAGK
ncbi:MAG: hypothetical protein AABY10_00670 [Nanoarchaeota archaeon]